MTEKPKIAMVNTGPGNAAESGALFFRAAARDYVVGANRIVAVTC